MRKLITRVFYIPVDGLSRQQAQIQIADLISDYSPDYLPDDIKEQYHIENLWFPVTGGQPCKVEVIYPPKFEVEDLDLENLDKLIDKLNEIKLKLIEDEK